MGVLIKNADITIYHLDPKTQFYSRININDVNWNSKRNSNISEKGVVIVYTAMIIIPKSTHVISIGDKIVKGFLDLDIAKLTDLKNYEVVTVVGVQDNFLLNTTNIECK